MSCVVYDGVAADGEGCAANKEVVDKTEMEEEGEEGEGNNADAVIGERHSDRATNTTTLQMLKTRDLVVCLSFYSSYRSQLSLGGRISCSARCSLSSADLLPSADLILFVPPPSLISLPHRLLACAIPFSLGLSFCQKS